ncbi:uncharacterized protein LOC120844417 [Ixodes scapularis]|uniref:uncharacterized protein LOC120844417 n=1 Tax=Ixodes scapularis TaxID=6945 RepID=UPI001A9ED7A3|nr:uncharacterized protein LOC120844417 [Ixodes scapularis]
MTPRSRTLPNKTILCTFGSGWRRTVAPPKEGLCDIIFWDFFYKSARGSFLDRSSVGLQWFLEFARNDSGTTQFGIGINYGNALGAYDDLNKALGMNTFRDLWNMNIRHYGLLKFQVHDYFVTQRSTVQDYDKLLKRLRELQEVNRAGDVMKFGYIILGVGLFAPRNGQVYDYLEELLRTLFETGRLPEDGHHLVPSSCAAGQRGQCERACNIVTAMEAAQKDTKDMLDDTATTSSEVV